MSIKAFNKVRGCLGRDDVIDGINNGEYLIIKGFDDGRTLGDNSGVNSLSLCHYH